MGFVRYVGEGRVVNSKPMASIRANAKIGLNRAAVRKYRLNKFSHVVLFFEDATRYIGMMFTNDIGEAGAVRLCHSKDGKDTYISASSFLRKYSLLRPKSVSCPIEDHSPAKTGDAPVAVFQVAIPLERPRTGER